MKIIALILCLLFTLGLWGCNAKTPDPTVPEVTVATTEPPHKEKTLPTDPTQEAIDFAANSPVLVEGSEGPLFLILTDYFSLSLPAHWADTCVYTVNNLGPGTYSVTIYEADDYRAFGGGALCTLRLLQPEEDHTIFPSYEYLGVLNTPDGVYNLVVLYPTDVQFSPETMDVYNQMYDELPDVLITLNPVKGVVLALP